jgi:hypothetical protein
MRKRVDGGNDRPPVRTDGGNDRPDEQPGDQPDERSRERRDDARRRAAGVPVGEPPSEDRDSAESAESPSESDEGDDAGPATPDFSIEDPDPPWPIAWAGELGVYLAVLAVVLAVVGVTLAGLRIQPLGNVAIVASLGLVTVAMLFGMVFQAYISDIPMTSEGAE